MRTPGPRFPALLLLVGGCLAATPLGAQVDVLTQRNDNTRSGTNLQEVSLNTSNVNNARFGKLVFRIVDGNIYAQPLIVSQARIVNRADARNVALVATQHNSVYAFDAEDTNQASTTAELWHTGPAVLGTPIEATEVSQAVGLGIAGCRDLTTEVGITSTPVVALTKETPPKEGVIFVVGKSKSGTAHVYRLFALRLADGARLGEIAIEGEVPGTGFGATGADPKIRFDPRIQLNRPALLLHDNVLYVAFGGHCDRPRGEGSYHGWLFAYDVSDPTAPRKLDVFCTTPNGRGSELEGRGGIWMSGHGAAVDESGSIYLVTGDGTNNGTTDFGNSVLRIKLVGGKFQVQDWYAPQNRDQLNRDDADLGAGGAVPVPNSHLLLAGGKEGRMYLIDRDDMGRGVKLSRQSFQVTHPPEGPHVYYNIHGSPVIWPRQGHMFVYVNGEEDPLKQYKLVPDTGPGGAGWKFESETPTARSAVTAPYPNFPAGQFGDPSRDMVWMPGGFLSLSADGDKEGTGIIWVNMPFAQNANKMVVRGVLRAFDASDVSRPQLWDSEHTGNDNDRLGQFAKFCAPTVANGKVYMATFQAEAIVNDIHVKRAGGDQPALAIYGLR
jgi:hypothetical protein